MKNYLTAEQIIKNLIDENKPKQKTKEEVLKELRNTTSVPKVNDLYNEAISLGHSYVPIKNTKLNQLQFSIKRAFPNKKYVK